MRRVKLTTFQVGVVYLINESGFMPSIKSVNGVPWDMIEDPGIYEESLDGWNYVYGSSKAPGVNDDESFIEWLTDQGISYSIRDDGEIIPATVTPSSPKRVKGCAYSDGWYEEDETAEDIHSVMPESENVAVDKDPEDTSYSVEAEESEPHADNENMPTKFDEDSKVAKPDGVIIDTFQVGAIYFINESGYLPEILSCNGVPAEYIEDAGVYRKDGYGGWRYVPETSKVDGVNKDEKFIEWLAKQDVDYSVSHGLILPERKMPNNPERVPGCVYSDGWGEENNTEQEPRYTSSLNASEEPKHEPVVVKEHIEVEQDDSTVYITGIPFKKVSVGNSWWTCGGSITEFNDACYNGFDGFWSKWREDFERTKLAFMYDKIGWINISRTEAVPTSEWLDPKRWEPIRTTLAKAITAYGKMKMGENVSEFSLKNLSGAMFGQGRYDDVYKFILTGKH